MKNFLKILSLTFLFISFSSLGYSEPDFFYTDISVKTADLNGDGNLETVRLKGEVDLNTYDISKYNYFEHQFVEFINTRIFIEDFKGSVLYSAAVPQGLFEKLVLTDFSGDGLEDIFFSFHDPNFPNIDHIILSFKDNKITQLFNGTLGHNGLDSTKYLTTSVSDNYRIKLNSAVSNLNIETSLARNTRNLYEAFFDEYGRKVYQLPTALTHPYFSDLDIDHDGVSELVEFSKFKTSLGEEILSLQTIYKWKNDRWIPFKLNASPLNYDINIKLNGKYLFFDSEPVIKNSRTLVPMRAIFEIFKADIVWDEATRTVTAYKDDIIITVKVDENTAYINNLPVLLDAPPTLIDSRTMIPVRFISESLGAFVDWDNYNRDVLIEK